MKKTLILVFCSILISCNELKDVPVKVDLPTSSNVITTKWSNISKTINGGIFAESEPFDFTPYVYAKISFHVDFDSNNTEAHTYYYQVPDLTGSGPTLGLWSGVQSINSADHIRYLYPHYFSFRPTKVLFRIIFAVYPLPDTAFFSNLNITGYKY